MTDNSCPRRVRTGLFGGSFNPIHNGHIALAEALTAMPWLDEVWLLVSPQNPLKRESDLLDDDIRLSMARMAVEDVPHVDVSDYEFRLPRPSYMWNTLTNISRDYPQREFSLIIGADNWLCFDRWFAHDEILANYGVTIYPRRGYAVDVSSLPAGVRLVNLPLYDVSSTLIRRLLRKGEPIDRFVPPCVAQFIRENNFYL